MNPRHVRVVALPVALVAAWFAIAQFRLVSPLFVPTVPATIVAFFDAIGDGTLALDVIATLGRMVAGFAIAVLVGTPIGLLMGMSKKTYEALEFVVDFFRSIPTTALFPLFLLAFGIGDVAKVAVVVWGTGLIIVVNAMHGVHQAKELRLRAARVMRVRGPDLFRRVVFPEALPQLMAGYRVALSLALVIVVVTEMFLGTTHGLGRRIMDAELVYRTADMYMGILVTGMIGFGLNWLLGLAEKRFVHWRGK